jgi:S1-C subfamily serine protease
VNWVDLIILAALGLALFTGYRRGALLQVFSWGGFVVGLVVGAIIGPHIVDAFAPKTATGRALLGLGTFLGTAFIIEAFVAAAGVTLRRRITSAGIAKADRVIGAIIGVLLSLVGAWLLGVTLARGPSSDMARAVKGSGILRAIDAIAPRPPAVLAEIGRFLDRTGFPDVFAQLNPSLAPGVAPPPAALARDPEILAAAEATFKIESSGCGGVVDGSGFSVERGLMVTASHVVAGTRGTRVISPNGDVVRGTVVYIDTDRDIAVIRVTVGKTLTLGTAIAKRNTDGAAIGYPGGGPRTIALARVRAETNAVGRDIYSRRLVSRPIYVLASRVRQGNSGGPFVDSDGRVRGMIFAASTSDPDEAYALTGSVIADALAKARGRTAGVRTGECAL